ncbi:hypothetical protein HH308_11200 [Gordonia sp. TBRC 11910]|uniref:RiboL-PSP-HEPN domain-containing protein n=1 Tax=Gordonia asplenii TaxID=2725283 RepID=A0A848KU91_9ACTN|nr:hypothetical protein [Gordonia asplenii]NMO01779.1 hypothetical protein [Gordonia asplenii]
MTYPALRATRPAGRGRLTHAEHDLFRAAVVFAGAGVDSVLKQAVRSCIPIQVEKSDGAREKYIDFAAAYLQNQGTLNARQVAKLLVTTEPEQTLRAAYVDSLTGSSLQSQSQVTATLAALGLAEQRELFKDAKGLNPLFKARNEIAHEMDMTPSAVKGRGKRTRHERAMNTYVTMCHTGLDYCQRVLNALADEV